jgi:hypothetical protein
MVGGADDPLVSPPESLSVVQPSGAVIMFFMEKGRAAKTLIRNANPHYCTVRHAF